MTRAACPLPHIPERRRRPAGEERREAILAALEDLLRQRPLAEINIGDISRAAGVTRSGFYFYFASKGAAVTAMLGDVFAEMIAGASEFVEGSSPTTETVRTAMLTAWNSWREHQDLILATLDARGCDPAVSELWEAWIERFVVALADAVERATEGTAAAPGGRELVGVLLGANERAFERLSRAGADPDAAARTVEALVAVWSQALYGTYQPPEQPR
ncbi:MAG: TetR/AcrR family transcriptional regulator [Pseudonocardia sp.]|nr:TetR/AcrR family transcriptional regulator [Pseudonocardia sp.]